MITRITKENRGKYAKLFVKAAEALKAGNSTNYPEDFSITTLEEYFQNIEELFELDPQFIRLPLDEETFDIDLNARQIIIPASFKKAGLGVQGDDLAETVYFRCDRYFDATDLNETFIIVQWEAPNGTKMASPAYFQEVDSETDKLIFGWAVTKEMTALPGTLKFSVAFIDGEVVTSEGNELDVNKLQYRLGTLTNSITINSGLSIANQGMIKFESRLKDLRSRIKNTPILGGIIEGTAELAEIIAYKGFDWLAPKTINNVFTDLVDRKDTNELETGLPLLAVSPNAGLVSYTWYKVGTELDEEGNTIDIELYSGPGATEYIPVDYPEDNKINEAIYFIKEGADDFRYFDEVKDTWMITIDGKEVINPLLYERVAFLPVDGPGQYYAVITNKEGLKTSQLSTKENLVTVPAPMEIKAVTIGSDSDIFSEENPVKIVSVVEMMEDTEFKSLEYQWCMRTTDEEGKVVDTPIAGATNAEYNADKVGTYTLKVKNKWNKAISAEVVSGNVIKVYLSAATPVVTKLSSDKLLFEGNEKVGVIGGTLTPTYTVEPQAEAKVYVRWMFDAYEPENIEEWVFLKNEDGSFVEQETLTPTEPGFYKAVVYNYITETNQQFKESEAIQMVIAGADEAIEVE